MNAKMRGTPNTLPMATPTASATVFIPANRPITTRSGPRSKRCFSGSCTYTKITKLVLPSALPLIFTGLRLSLGVGWMVLIAAEMLAQNPGLGKFVWDEFQNGSSQSLARIMVAVFTIGIIGFLLDRVMYALQSMFTFSNNR